jgi:uncharacterized protein YjiS (DUF1127 family)
MTKMNIFTAVFRRSAKQRTYSDLMQMDERLLRDIGLSRSVLHQMMTGNRTAHTRGHRAHE